MQMVYKNQTSPTGTTPTINELQKAIKRYDKIKSNDQETQKRAREIILAASKKIIENGQTKHIKHLASKEGTKTRLRKISSYTNQLCNLLEPVLLHIDEVKYARSIVEEFIPSLEEAARFATKLEPNTAAQMLRILDSAETLGLNFNHGLREVFEEVIQIQITPNKLESTHLLLDLAEKRLKEGEYLTSYLLSREATRTMVEDITEAYTKDLDSKNSPSPDWSFEDYLGYLIEVGLVNPEQGEEFLDLFVGEVEHLNNRWKRRIEAEKAMSRARDYWETINSDNAVNREWL